MDQSLLVEQLSSYPAVDVKAALLLGHFRVGNLIVQLSHSEYHIAHTCNHRPLIALRATSGDKQTKTEADAAQTLAQTGTDAMPGTAAAGRQGHLSAAEAPGGDHSSSCSSLA